MMVDADIATYTFPFRLYHMLEQADKAGFDDVVSWLPEGNGFVVHDRDKFTDRIMKIFFSHTKWKSFLRQLNLYNFQRLSKRGPGQGSCYAHPCLIRGEIEKCKQIHRASLTTTTTSGMQTSGRVSETSLSSRTKKESSSSLSCPKQNTEMMVLDECGRVSPTTLKCRPYACDAATSSKLHHHDHLRLESFTMKDVASMLLMGDGTAGHSHQHESNSITVWNSFLTKSPRPPIDDTPVLAGAAPTTDQPAAAVSFSKDQLGCMDASTASQQSIPGDKKETLRSHTRLCSPDPIGNPENCIYVRVGSHGSSFSRDMADAIVSIFGAPTETL